MNEEWRWIEKEGEREREKSLRESEKKTIYIEDGY